MLNETSAGNWFEKIPQAEGSCEQSYQDEHRGQKNLSSWMRKPRHAVTCYLGKYKENECLGIVQDRYMFMTNYLVVGRKRGIRSGFWLESGRTNIVKLQRMCWGQDYKFGCEKGFPKVPRKWVCGNSMEISPRIKKGSELWIQVWEPFV